MQDKKHSRGDRPDGKVLRGLDSLHLIMPYIYRNRADNEAFIVEEIDLTALELYLEKKNIGKTTDKYTMMQAVMMALVRTITLRPKMNRFVKGGRIYQRNDISVSFVVKKQFHDESEEALAFKVFGPETTMDSLHDEIVKEIHSCRSDKLDNTTDAMDILGKLPRFVLRFVMWVLLRLDNCGKVPHDLIKADPNHATVMLSNLGSIGLNSAYHHLSNWGTMSMFMVIGKKKIAPVFHEDGTYDMRPILPLGITLDERIADGYYYARSIEILRHLLQNPDLLDQRADQEVVL